MCFVTFLSKKLHFTSFTTKKQTETGGRPSACLRTGDPPQPRRNEPVSPATASDAADIMATPGGPSLPGFRQLSVHLVDCLRTPADPGPAVRRETQDSTEKPSVLLLKELSVRLVDCMRTAGPNGQTVPEAAEQPHEVASIEVELEEEEEKQMEADDCVDSLRQIKTERDEQPGWWDAGARAENCLLKVEAETSECDSKDESCEKTKTEKPDELQPDHTGADGTPEMIQEAAMVSRSEERQDEEDHTCRSSQNGPADNTTTSEAHEAAGPEAFEPGGEDELAAEQRNHCSRTGGTLDQPDSEQTEQEARSCNRSSLVFQTKRNLRVRKHKENRENYEGQDASVEAPQKKLYACKQCTKKFYLLHTLQKHLLTHTGEKLYSCQVCKKQFGSKGTLKNHQLIHSGEKQFKCEQCGKTCARKGDLKVHMLSHSEERPYSCSYCKRSFKQLQKLKQHERVHTGEKPYQCKFCPKQFRLGALLAEHQYTHSGEKPFKCTLCPKAFGSRNNLKKHQMIHTGEKPYCCSHCGKSCRLLQHLISHERSHTGEKPYKCDECGKGYSHPSHLKSHKSTHEEKPPHCSLCRQNFASLAELTSHVCCKMAEKPHRCTQCGKRFSQAVSLKKHRLIHTGEKPYDCTECGKQFNHKGNLTKHIRIHTGERPFECELCKKGFRLLQHLQSHRSTHHKKD